MTVIDKTAKLGGGYAWWVWALAVTFVVYLFSVQTGYAIVNQDVSKSVGLTVTQVATIAATYTWVFALCQFFGGALLDQLGSRKVLPLSIAMVTVGVFVFANAKSFEMLLLSQAILAAGSCTGFVGAGYIGGQWFGMAKFSFMFGLVQVVAALTSAGSQNAIEFALRQTDWRTLFNFTAAGGVALFVLGMIYIRNPAPVPAPARKGASAFFSSVGNSLLEVAKSGHVWLASVIGAALFGVMLSLGVIWCPKLLMARGAAESSAVMGSSMLWLGLAVGSALVPWWSDRIRARKMPLLTGTVVQLAALLWLVYVPSAGTFLDLVACFVFGFANAAHMLAFSTSADVVKPSHIGTSAAVVNGLMFIFGGLMMSRPGVRIDRAIESGIPKGSMDMVQYASLPLVAATALALLLCFFLRETHPERKAEE